MKKLLCIISALLLLASAGAFAQGRMDPADRAKDLKEKLGLTDDQTVKVRKIFEDAQSEAMAQMNGDSGSRGDRRAAMQQMMAKTQDKIKALLTDEQKDKYQKLLDERKSRRMNKN